MLFQFGNVLLRPILSAKYPHVKLTHSPFTQQCAKSAEEAGNRVELLRLKGKEIQYCIGCLACLETRKCVQVVRGNNNKAWAERIPASLTFRIEGFRFFLVHNKKEVPKTLTGIDAVIFGHSHKYFEQMIDGRLWLNPGSCGKRQFDQEITLAILTLNGKTSSVQKITIQP